MKSCNYPECQSLEPLSEADMKTHRKLIHQSSTAFTVDDRSFTFTRSDDGSFHCSDCSYKSENPDALNQHFKRHHGSLNKPTQARTPFLEQSASELLTQWSLTVHPDLCIIICQGCHSGVVRSEIGGHLRGHEIVVNNQAIEDALADAGFNQVNHGGLEGYTYNVGWDKKSAVQGIIVKDGFACQHCPYYCVERESLRVHICTKHKDIAMKLPGIQSKVQSIYSGSKRLYFGVADIDASGNQPSLSILVEKRALQSTPKPKSGMGGSVFYKVSKWMDLIEAVDAKVLSSLFQVPKESVLPALVQKYIDQVIESNPSTSFLKAVQDSKGDQKSNALFTFNTEASREKYAKEITRFLNFIQVLSSSNVLDSVYDLSDFIKQIWMEVEAEPNLDNFHCLCLALVKTKEDDSIDRTAFPMFRFLVYSSGRRAGSYMKSTEITQVVSRLQYFCRIVILYEIAVKGGGNHQENYQFLRDNHNTPFGGVSDIMHLASSTAASEPLKPIIQWSLNDGFRSMDIAGKRVSIEDLKTGTTKIFREAKSLMSIILLGLPLPENDLCSLFDDQSNRKEGYGFINDARNSFRNQTLATHIESSHAGQFILGVNTSGDLEMNRHQLKLWLNQVQDLQDLLLTLMHTTSGLPGRGTELSSMTFINTIHSTRNVFIVWGTVAFIADYNKVQALTKRDSIIARFLPKEIANVFVTYLSIVKPFQM